MDLRAAFVEVSRDIAYKLLPRKTFTIETDFGPFDFPHADAYAQRWISRSKSKLNGWHEPSMSWFVLLAGQTGMNQLLDIGAHVGYFSLLHTQRPGNTAFALELDPINFEILARVVSQASSIRIENLGASDEPGEISMASTGLPSPKVSLLGRSEDDSEGVSVGLVRVDNLVTQHDISPSLVKIDVEGAEGRVLQGARGFLSEKKPLVLVEVHPRQMAEMDSMRPDDIVRFMIDLGYEAFCFADSRSDSCSPIEPYAPRQDNQRDFDIIFVAVDAQMRLIKDYNVSLEEVRNGKFPDLKLGSKD